MFPDPRKLLPAKADERIATNVGTAGSDPTDHTLEDVSGQGVVDQDGPSLQDQSPDDSEGALVVVPKKNYWEHTESAWILWKVKPTKGVYGPYNPHHPERGPKEKMPC